MKPYFSDDSVTLYLGDCRKIIPQLDVVPDLIVADPPYGVTSHPWDRWPVGWPAVAAASGARSLWCFGSARSFDAYVPEIHSAGWHMSHDVIWDKGGGVGTVTDRFTPTHEHVRHYYTGRWDAVYYESPRQEVFGVRRGRVVERGAKDKGWHGERGEVTWVDDGKRMVHSVIYCRNMIKRANHPTEKPEGLLAPLIRYGCPPGGTVLDPFGGSCSTAFTARGMGRRAIIIELWEPFAEDSALRLTRGDLFAPPPLARRDLERVHPTELPAGSFDYEVLRLPDEREGA